MISIVTTYYNRKKQLIETLKSVSKSKYKDFEFIVVDDGSSVDQRLEDLTLIFSFLKIIRIEPKDKWYVNPCVPFNKGIFASIGDVIVLQNPECLHIHDVLTYFNENITEEKYITISTYAFDNKLTHELWEHVEKNSEIDFFHNVVIKKLGIGWYNHSKHKPSFFHFCAAISRKNMLLLNGFDERYANGIACDDAEFIIRIDRLGLNKIIVDEISVIHQYHPSVYYMLKNAGNLREKNGVLLNITKAETSYKANDIRINENINSNGNKT